jgi:hypothetical protein
MHSLLQGILASHQGKDVGFVLFHTLVDFDTLELGLHLEDLFVQESCRGLVWCYGLWCSLLFMSNMRCL